MAGVWQPESIRIESSAGALGRTKLSLECPGPGATPGLSRCPGSLRNPARSSPLHTASQGSQCVGFCPDETTCNTEETLEGRAVDGRAVVLDDVPLADPCGTNVRFKCNAAPPLLTLSPTNFPTSLPDNTSGVSQRTPRLGRREGHRTLSRPSPTRWDRHSVPLPSRRPGLCVGGAPGRHPGPRRGQGAPDPSEKPIQSRPLAQHVVGGASASERGEDRGASARPGARVPSRAASPGLPLGALPGALPPGRPLLLLQPLLLLAGQV